MIIKCLSVRQPYANAILAGHKTEEYRSWGTKYRGLLGIHAASAVHKAGASDFPSVNLKLATRSAIIGVVELAEVECRCDEDGVPFFAWKLAGRRWLARPLPMKGKLGLWVADVDLDGG